MTDIDDLQRKVNGLVGALKTSHEIIEFNTDTITRLEMEIRALRAIERNAPIAAMRHILDFALAAGYPNEEHLDEVAAFLSALEE